MLRGFNVSQQKVLLEKENKERGEYFPVSFLVLTNKACSSIEFFSFFLPQFSFSKLLVSVYLQVQAENCLTHDGCVFLVFFTVINLEKKQKQKEENLNNPYSWHSEATFQAFALYI